MLRVLGLGFTRATAGLMSGLSIRGLEGEVGDLS
jgi:hypothetical protein